MFDRRLFEALEREPRVPIARTPPVFPLPAFNAQPPVLLVFDPEDHGVEIAYENAPSEDRNRVRSATRESTLYRIPRMLPVFVAADGKVVYAREHADGFAVLVEHRDGWATYYTRLRHMFVSPTDRGAVATRLAGGDILGYVGPTRAGPLKPLRLEIWRGGRDEEYEAIDPIRYVTRWRLPRWTDSRIAPVTAPATPTRRRSACAPRRSLARRRLV
jgi:hypothetical protein